jgi:hypothetical protein
MLNKDYKSDDIGPKFRIVQFGQPQPGTGFRFFIEWKRWVWWKGFIPYKAWITFRDPSRLDGLFGYVSIEEAKQAVERYKINMIPTYHYV